ncbi:hypothetical protein P9112_007875 [Eukaryota sp. TZLM1-RC]
MSSRFCVVVVLLLVSRTIAENVSGIRSSCDWFNNPESDGSTPTYIYRIPTEETLTIEHTMDCDQFFVHNDVKVIIDGTLIIDSVPKVIVEGHIDNWGVLQIDNVPQFVIQGSILHGGTMDLNGATMDVIGHHSPVKLPFSSSSSSTTNTDSDSTIKVNCPEGNCLDLDGTLMFNGDLMVNTGILKIGKAALTYNGNFDVNGGSLELINTILSTDATSPLKVDCSDCLVKVTNSTINDLALKNGQVEIDSTDSTISSFTLDDGKVIFTEDSILTVETLTWTAGTVQGVSSAKLVLSNNGSIAGEAVMNDLTIELFAKINLSPCLTAHTSILNVEETGELEVSSTESCSHLLDLTINNNGKVNVDTHFNVTDVANGNTFTVSENGYLEVANLESTDTLNVLGTLETSSDSSRIAANLEANGTIKTTGILTFEDLSIGEDLVLETGSFVFTDHINHQGITISSNGNVEVYHATVVTDATSPLKVDCSDCLVKVTKSSINSLFLENGQVEIDSTNNTISSFTLDDGKVTLTEDSILTVETLTWTAGTIQGGSSAKLVLSNNGSIAGDAVMNDLTIELSAKINLSPCLTAHTSILNVEETGELEVSSTESCSHLLDLTINNNGKVNVDTHFNVTDVANGNTFTVSENGYLEVANLESTDTLNVLGTLETSSDSSRITANLEANGTIKTTGILTFEDLSIGEDLVLETGSFVFTDHINHQGITISSNGNVEVYHATVVTDATSPLKVDCSDCLVKVTKSSINSLFLENGQVEIDSTNNTISSFTLDDGKVTLTEDSVLTVETLTWTAGTIQGVSSAKLILSDIGSIAGDAVMNDLTIELSAKINLSPCLTAHTSILNVHETGKLEVPSSESCSHLLDLTINNNGKVNVDTHFNVADVANANTFTVSENGYLEVTNLESTDTLNVLGTLETSSDSSRITANMEANGTIKTTGILTFEDLSIGEDLVLETGSFVFTEHINHHGITISSNGNVEVYHATVATDADGSFKVDCSDCLVKVTKSTINDLALKNGQAEIDSTDNTISSFALDDGKVTFTEDSILTVETLTWNAGTIQGVSSAKLVLSDNSSIAGDAVMNDLTIELSAKINLSPCLTAHTSILNVQETGELEVPSSESCSHLLDLTINNNGKVNVDTHFNVTDVANGNTFTVSENGYLEIANLESTDTLNVLGTLETSSDSSRITANMEANGTIKTTGILTFEDLSIGEDLVLETGSFVFTDHINHQGITISSNGNVEVYHATVATDTDGSFKVDCSDCLVKVTKSTINDLALKNGQVEIDSTDNTISSLTLDDGKVTLTEDSILAVETLTWTAGTIQGGSSAKLVLSNNGSIAGDAVMNDLTIELSAKINLSPCLTAHTSILNAQETGELEVPASESCSHLLDLTINNNGKVNVDTHFNVTDVANGNTFTVSENGYLEVANLESTDTLNVLGTLETSSDSSRITAHLEANGTIKTTGILTFEDLSIGEALVLETGSFVFTEHINHQGITISSNGNVEVYHATVVTDATSPLKVDCSDCLVKVTKSSINSLFLENGQVEIDSTNNTISSFTLDDGKVTLTEDSVLTVETLTWTAGTVQGVSSAKLVLSNNSSIAGDAVMNDLTIELSAKINLSPCLTAHTSILNVQETGELEVPSSESCSHLLDLTINNNGKVNVDTHFNVADVANGNTFTVSENGYLEVANLESTDTLNVLGTIETSSDSSRITANLEANGTIKTTGILSFEDLSIGEDLVLGAGSFVFTEHINHQGITISSNGNVEVYHATLVTEATSPLKVDCSDCLVKVTKSSINSLFLENGQVEIDSTDNTISSFTLDDGKVTLTEDSVLTVETLTWTAGTVQGVSSAKLVLSNNGSIAGDAVMNDLTIELSAKINLSPCLTAHTSILNVQETGELEVPSTESCSHFLDLTINNNGKVNVDTHFNVADVANANTFTVSKNGYLEVANLESTDTLNVLGTLETSSDSSRITANLEASGTIKTTGILTFEDLSIDETLVLETGSFVFTEHINHHGITISSNGNVEVYHATVATDATSPLKVDCSDCLVKVTKSTINSLFLENGQVEIDSTDNTISSLTLDDGKVTLTEDSILTVETLTWTAGTIEGGSSGKLVLSNNGSIAGDAVMNDLTIEISSKINLSPCLTAHTSILNVQETGELEVPSSESCSHLLDLTINNNGKVNVDTHFNVADVANGNTFTVSEAGYLEVANLESTDTLNVLGTLETSSDSSRITANLEANGTIKTTGILTFEDLSIGEDLVLETGSFVFTEHINHQGITISSNGNVEVYHATVATDADGSFKVDCSDCLVKVTKSTINDLALKNGQAEIDSTDNTISSFALDDGKVTFTEDSILTVEALTWTAGTIQGVSSAKLIIFDNGSIAGDAVMNDLTIEMSSKINLSPCLTAHTSILNVQETGELEVSSSESCSHLLDLTINNNGKVNVGTHFNLTEFINYGVFQVPQAWSLECVLKINSGRTDIYGDLFSQETIEITGGNVVFGNTSIHAVDINYKEFGPAFTSVETEYTQFRGVYVETLRIMEGNVRFVNDPSTINTLISSTSSPIVVDVAVSVDTFIPAPGSSIEGEGVISTPRGDHSKDKTECKWGFFGFDCLGTCSDFINCDECTTNEACGWILEDKSSIDDGECVVVIDGEPKVDYNYLLIETCSFDPLDNEETTNYPLAGILITIILISLALYFTMRLFGKEESKYIPRVHLRTIDPVELNDVSIHPVASEHEIEIHVSGDSIVSDQEEDKKSAIEVIIDDVEDRVVSDREKLSSSEKELHDTEHTSGEEDTKEETSLSVD